MESKRLFLTFLLVAGLSGCVWAPPLHHPVPPGLYLSAPSSADLGVAPGPGYFWLDGRWFLDDGRRVWQPGRWERRSHNPPWPSPYRHEGHRRH